MMVSLRDDRQSQRSCIPGRPELPVPNAPRSPKLVRIAFAALILTASLAHPLQFTTSSTPNRFRHLDPKLVLPSPVQVHTNDTRTSG